MCDWKLKEVFTEPVHREVTAEAYCNMSDSFELMVTGVAAGAGLGLLGTANAVLRRKSLLIRIPLTLAVIGSMSGLAYAATDAVEPAYRVALVLVLSYAAILLAGSNWLASGIASLLATLRAPVARWGTVGAVGVFAALGTVAYVERAEEAAIDRDLAELEALMGPPPSQSPSIRALTDSGREVAIKEAIAPRDDAEMKFLEETLFTHSNARERVIRCQPASDRSNCHGWVFTGGRYWISGTGVDPILVDNGYRTVTEPQPGDLVVYRTAETVSHTAVVRYVTENQPVLVEGKWGCTGVYLHPVDKSIYGVNFQFYRSTRSGHLLAGLHSSDPNIPQGSPLVVPNPANPDEFTE